MMAWVRAIANQGKQLAIRISLRRQLQSKILWTCHDGDSEDEQARCFELCYLALGAAPKHAVCGLMTEQLATHYVWRQTLEIPEASAE